MAMRPATRAASATCIWCCWRLSKNSPRFNQDQRQRRGNCSMPFPSSLNGNLREDCLCGKLGLLMATESKTIYSYQISLSDIVDISKIDRLCLSHFTKL